ncbi:unnamed protein product [Calypogeia fissa]
MNTIEAKPSPHKYPWCGVCVSKNSEHETTKEWLEREIIELEGREKEALAMLCNMMGRIYHEGHGTIRWDQEKKMFQVALERLYKERINRRELMNLLRLCVELMMDLVPTFRGVRVDIIKEQKRMLEGGRFTQRRVQNGMIQWFINGLPNKCFIRIAEILRDTGIVKQPKYIPGEMINLHCMGGNDQPKILPYCRPIAF